MFSAYEFKKQQDPAQLARIWRPRFLERLGAWGSGTGRGFSCGGASQEYHTQGWRMASILSGLQGPDTGEILKKQTHKHNSERSRYNHGLSSSSCVNAIPGWPPATPVTRECDT